MTLEGTEEENDKYNDIDDEFDDDCRLCLVTRAVKWEQSPYPLGINIIYYTIRSILIGGL